PKEPPFRTAPLQTFTFRSELDACTTDNGVDLRYVLLTATGAARSDLRIPVTPAEVQGHCSRVDLLRHPEAVVVDFVASDDRARHGPRVDHSGRTSSNRDSRGRAGTRGKAFRVTVLAVEGGHTGAEPILGDTGLDLPHVAVFFAGRADIV